MAPFARGTPRPARPPALRAPLDSQPPHSGGLRRRYDGPLAAATASRRPTDRHRPPPLLQSPGPADAQAGTNERGQRQLDSPSGLDPCRFPGRCRRPDLGDRYLGAAPFWRLGAHRAWLWQLPSPRAWARQRRAPRAIGTAGSSDRDRRTLCPWPQFADRVVRQIEIVEACRSRASWAVSLAPGGSTPTGPSARRAGEPSIPRAALVSTASGGRSGTRFGTGVDPVTSRFSGRFFSLAKKQPEQQSKQKVLFSEQKSRFASLSLAVSFCFSFLWARYGHEG